jgi:hypothetical protein
MDHPTKSGVVFITAVETKAARFTEALGDVCKSGVALELRRKAFALGSAMQSHQQPSHVGIACEDLAALAFMVWRAEESFPEDVVTGGSL